MALKIRNLEHLDGKRVSQSTLTSQYPEVFVNRKKNTGEWIVTTDTDPVYGMHHIYLGGEHIAGGYGFATVKTRDDLCYIQETYNGIFNYFNQAYAYHNNAYQWLRQYAYDSYSYTITAINDNTYKNTTVNPNFNHIITANGITYTFVFNNGELSVYPYYDALWLDFGDNRYLNRLDDNVIVNNAYISNEYTKVSWPYLNIDFNIKVQNDYNNDEYVDNSLDAVVRPESGLDEDIETLNSFKLTSFQGNISQYYKSQINKELNSLNKNITLPVPYDKDVIIDIRYDILRQNTDNNKVEQTIINKPLTIKWLDPIYLTTVHKSFLFDEDNNLITNNEKLRNIFVKDKENPNTNAHFNNDSILVDFENIKEYKIIHEDKKEEYGHVNTHDSFNRDYNYYLVFAIPKVIANDFVFYMSNDVDIREHRPGGFIQINGMDNPIIHTHSKIEDVNIEYIYYYTNPQFFNKTIRIDLVKINK